MFKINVKYKSAHSINPSDIPVLRLSKLLKEVKYYGKGARQKDAELLVLDPAPYLVSNTVYNIYGTNRRAKFLQ